MAIAIAAIGTVGLITSFLGSKKAAKAAKEEAKEEARLEGLVTGEKIRNLGIEERTLYGDTLANYAMGGVQGIQPNLGASSVTSGSPATIIAEQKKSFAAQKDITSKVGASKAQAALTRGKNVADYYRWSGYANVASSASNILTNYAAMT
jgi:hypothetical protein